MARPIPTHKICNKHGEVTEEKRYYYKTRTGKTSFRCRLCINENSRKFKILNPQYHKSEEMKKKHEIANKRWMKNNPDKVKAIRKKHAHKYKEWYEANKITESYKIKKRLSDKKCRERKIDHYREIDRTQQQRDRDRITDGYMNRLLFHRKMRDIPYKEKIREYLRAVLMLKREIRELK